MIKGYINIDFKYNFSPITKLTKERTFLAIANTKNWHIVQCDVNNVLNGGVNEEICMTPTTRKNSVCGQEKNIWFVLS